MDILDKNNLNHRENKTVIDYCEDIIKGHYYDLSKLKELNVIKAVYDENNIVKWYINGFEQAYTTYRELRKGLEEYVWQLKNGQYYKGSHSLKFGSQARLPVFNRKGKHYETGSNQEK